MKLQNFCVLFAISLSYSGCSHKIQLSVVENDNFRVQFHEDLSGIKSYLDKKRGCQYASGLEWPVYSIGFGGNYDSLKYLSAGNADRKSFKKTEKGLELDYWHDHDIKLKVSCKVQCGEVDSLLHWSIQIENFSEQTICSVEYPQIPCTNVLGETSEDDAVVFPVYEGDLLTGIKEEGSAMRARYPGPASAQFMYYFDPSGGLYYASYDGKGYPKDLRIKNESGSIVLSQAYLLPVHYEKEAALPYEVVTGCFGGRWESGAGVYREWSDRQLWTEKTIGQKNTPSWLKEPNLFINASIGPGFNTVDEADRMMRKYHDFFDIPVVMTFFRWEKHGSWIGPDYFPPKPGREFYTKLSGKVRERGDHLHLYSSGFRWGVRKTVSEDSDKPRKYTSYDGNEDFLKKGKSLAVTDSKNELLIERRPWAENYLLCIGDKRSRDILDSCYNYIYGMGISGVDLDQQLAGEVDICYNTSHGHPKGAGFWQTQAMEKFLYGISEENRNREGAFQGIEEPCERYIPCLDVFHGRSFTATDWPAIGPGAVIIPLYLYLYHQYQIGYAGWIDGRFSPAGNVKCGLGRAFIFGMYPGIRARGSTELNPEKPSEDLKMLKGYVQLIKKFPEYLLHGRMLGELQIRGSDPFNQDVGSGDTIPVEWNAVQGIAWLSVSGDRVGYALANLSGKSQKIRVKLGSDNGQEYGSIGYVLDKEVKRYAMKPHNGWLDMVVQPWELAFILVAD